MKKLSAIAFFRKNILVDEKNEIAEPYQVIGAFHLCRHEPKTSLDRGPLDRRHGS